MIAIEIGRSEGVSVEVCHSDWWDYISRLEGHYIKPGFLKHKCLFHTILTKTYLLSKLLLISILVKSADWCFYTAEQIYKRRWFNIYLLFVYIQILPSCGLQFPADNLIVFSNLHFSVSFSSRLEYRLCLLFLFWILWAGCSAMWHAALTVTCWTFLCSLRVFWTSLDCSPSATGNTEVQNACRNHCDGCENRAGGYLHWREESLHMST